MKNQLKKQDDGITQSQIKEACEKISELSKLEPTTKNEIMLLAKSSYISIISTYLSIKIDEILKNKKLSTFDKEKAVLKVILEAKNKMEELN